MLRPLSVECECMQKLLIILYIVLLYNVDELLYFFYMSLVNRFIGKPVKNSSKGLCFQVPRCVFLLCYRVKVSYQRIVTLGER